MSYFVLRGASQRTKSFTSFALAAIMIFQAFGPGVFALKEASAYVDPNGTATVTATKIVCNSETLLPNWGAGSADVDATTAATFLAAHPNDCHQVPWNFAWSEDGVGNPGDEVIGTGGDGWNGFSDSVATLIPAGRRVWFREQFQNGYIPFTGQNTTESISAEIYCGSDVVHYDNWEYIDTVAGGNYHCVAWNVQLPGTPEENPPCLVPVLVLPGDRIETIGASSGPEVTLQSVLDTQYPPVSTVDDIDDETGIQAWTISPGTNSVTVNAKLLSASAGNTNDLGYYFDNDTSTFVSLFVVPGYTSPAIDTGSVVIPTVGHTKIAFAIKSGANTFASQYNLNASNEDHVAVYQPVTGTYAVAFEDLPFSGSDKDYNDLVAEIKIEKCNGGSQCVSTSGMVSSGTDTLVTDINGTPTAPNTPSVFVSTVPAIQALGTGVWGATTTDATAQWIWSEDMVSDWTADKFVTFKKDFTVTGTPTNGTLQIASDNSYEVWVNGNIANPANFSDASEDNHSAIDTWNVTSLLVTGTNTLTVRVKNIGINVAQSNNPGGLLYTLSWASNCDGGGSSDEDTSTITIHKYIDGQPATSEIAGETTFNVETTESSVGEVNNNWVGVRNLNDENNYTYISNLLVDEHNTFIANEVIGGDIIGPNAECAPGKFKLGGYSYGPTLNDAFTAASSTSAHQFQNISSDQHVIVWNEACPSAPQFSTVTMCKVDTSTEPRYLSGWKLMLLGSSVQTGLSVDSTSTAGTNSLPLVAGASYVAKATGTWANQGGVNLVDAEYSTVDGWVNQMDGYTGYPTGILELQIAQNPSFGDWGAYNNGHTYMQGFSPLVNGAVNFRIFDGDANTNIQDPSWYLDNSGSLSVDINHGYIGVTGEDGCISFSNVPYGEYSTDEVAQDGWTNVSGLGPVIVDEPTERFTVVNQRGIIVVDDECTEDCGGGGENDTPTETLIPTGGSGSRSGQQRGGSVAGANTNVPQVLGASTDLPSMPDTGNGAKSHSLLIALSIFGALIATNAIAIRKMRNS